MKLVHEDHTFTLDFDAHPVQGLIVENPKELFQFITDISDQLSGQPGKFILSQGVKEVQLDKTAILVTDCFRLDLNQRKILTEVYKRLQAAAMDESSYMQTAEVISLVQKYLNDLVLDFDSTLIVSSEIDAAGLFKLAGVQFDEVGLSFPEKLLSYFRIMREFSHVSLCIFVHLLPILSKEDWDLLLENIRYEGYSILLLEHTVPEGYNGINFTIIDDDLCEVF